MIEKGWNERLRQKRREAKMTMGDVAEKTGLSVVSIMNYEKGRSCPKADVLAYMCDLYSCDIGYVIYGREVPLWATLRYEAEATAVEGE